MDTTSSLHPSIREPGPTHDEVAADIAAVRKRGVGNVRKPLVDLVALSWVAERACPDDPDDGGVEAAEKIEYVIRQAVSRLGGKSTQAAEALLGLSYDTLGHSVYDRREKAAALHGKSYETFRVRYETALLTMVAAYLRILVEEKRLATWEERLVDIANEAADSPEPESSELVSNDDCENGPAFPFERISSVTQLVELAKEHSGEDILQPS
ncbi:MAG: hypothetical protein ACYDHN_11745 [Solirubrobacteraceae bacterium]